MAKWKGVIYVQCCRDVGRYSHKERWSKVCIWPLHRVLRSRTGDTFAILDADEINMKDSHRTCKAVWGNSICSTGTTHKHEHKQARAQHRTKAYTNTNENASSPARPAGRTSHEPPLLIKKTKQKRLFLFNVIWQVWRCRWEEWVTTYRAGTYSQDMQEEKCFN